MLGAKVRIVGTGCGAGCVPVEDFFTGPGCTVLEPGEIVAEIRVPGARRQAAPRSTRSTACGGWTWPWWEWRRWWCPREMRAAISRSLSSAVAPTPMRAIEAEGVLRGRTPTEDLIAAAARAAAEESRPITDIRGSARVASGDHGDADRPGRASALESREAGGELRWRPGRMMPGNALATRTIALTVNGKSYEFEVRTPRDTGRSC